MPKVVTRKLSLTTSHGMDTLSRGRECNPSEGQILVGMSMWNNNSFRVFVAAYMKRKNIYTAKRIKQDL
jgi:hypothetical protein